MPSRSRFVFSRRRLLLTTSGVAASASFFRFAQAAGPREVRIVAKPGRVALSGAGHPATDVWAYDGQVPGPILRLHQGEPVRITVENRLEQETTVHWHGIRLPISMDGVPGISQAP